MRSIRFRKKSTSGLVTGGESPLRRRLSRSYKFAGASFAISVLVIVPLIALLIIPSVSALPVGGPGKQPADPPAKSGGGKSAAWVDHNHLTIDGVTYVDAQNDNDEKFSSQSSNGNGCDDSYVDSFPAKGGNPDNANGPATLHTFGPVNPPTDMTCQETKYTINSFKNQTNFTYYFVWADSGTIQTADGGSDMTFVKKDNNLYVDNGDGDANKSGQCLSSINADPAHPGKGTLIMRTSNGGDAPFGSGWAPQVTGADLHKQGSCDVSDPISVNIGNVDAATKQAAAGGGAGGAGEADDQLGCDGSSSPLTWIICPVINDVMVPAISATDKLITQQMTLPADQIFCSTGDTCKAYYTAWSTFRNLALGLLVVAGLIVVIGQAVGMEILDAYTVRKVLPRILIASIAITLSWALMNFAVTLSNDLGFGVRHLITAPFSNLSLDLNFDLSDSPIINTFFGGAAVVGAAAVAAPIWIAAGGLGVLLSYVATAGLAVLIAVLVLVLRQIAIIMLILLSPIALVAYVLPNTQRVFRLWWESFSKALLMFPLIAAFIAAGRVFAAISLSGAGGGGDVFHGIIGFVAYFAPYFLIPMTFRLSGGIMSGIGGFVQQRSQGMSQGLSSFRGNQRQSRIARARQTGLYRKDLGQFNYRLPGDKRRGKDPRVGGVGRMMNRAGFYSLNADEMIPMKLGGTRERGGLHLPGFRRGAEVLYSQIDAARVENTQKALQQVNPGYKGGRMLGGMWKGKKHDYLSGLNAEDRAEFDDKFALRDSSGAIQRDSTGEAVGYREADSYKARTTAADILSRSSDPEAREGAAELRTAAARIDSLNKSPDSNYADPRLIGLMAAARDGRLEDEDIQTNHKALRAKGQEAEAQRETVMLQELATQKRTSLARGHAYEYDEHGNIQSVYADPLSKKAMVSIDRQSQDDWRDDKAEDMQDEHGEAWIAALSEHPAEFDKASKKVKILSGPKSQQEVEDARIRQNKFKSMVLYHAGDTGMERELRRIWQGAGLSLADLDRDLARGALERGGAAAPEAPKAEPPPET